MTKVRTCEKTHPWLTFNVDMRRAGIQLWIMLGECHSKCEHLAGVPLDPEIDQHLHQVYLAKGVAATTAIEGNTLSEKQVLEHIEGKLQVAPSQEYLRKEIDNILTGCNLILGEIIEGTPYPVTPDRIKQLNRLVLNGLELADRETIPGEIRKHSVGAGSYRGAPAEDWEYLIDRLCGWLNGPDFEPAKGQECMYAILKAVLAHVYLAWIHPFGDGNGRTARLMEVQILLSSGIPSPAAQLLSNHYNKTRSDYYRHLDAARENVLTFVEYAVQGLRDELREQIEAVRFEQWGVAWVNHVHRKFDGLDGSVNKRRKYLVLDLSKSAEPVPFAKIRELSPRVAVAYKDKTDRTLFRDLDALAKMKLIKKKANGRWAANRKLILAFLPARARPTTIEEPKRGASKRLATPRARRSNQHEQSTKATRAV